MKFAVNSEPFLEDEPDPTPISPQGDFPVW